jgi:hypothetical protein
MAINEHGSLVIKNVSASPVTLDEIPGTPTLQPNDTFDLAFQDPDPDQHFAYLFWELPIKSPGCQIYDLIQAGDLELTDDVKPGTWVEE